MNKKIIVLGDFNVSLGSPFGDIVGSYGGEPHQFSGSLINYASGLNLVAVNSFEDYGDTWRPRSASQSKGNRIDWIFADASLAANIEMEATWAHNITKSDHKCFNLNVNVHVHEQCQRKRRHPHGLPRGVRLDPEVLRSELQKCQFDNIDGSNFYTYATPLATAAKSAIEIQSKIIFVVSVESIIEHFTIHDGLAPMELFLGISGVSQLSMLPGPQLLQSKAIINAAVATVPGGSVRAALVRVAQRLLRHYRRRKVDDATFSLNDVFRDRRATSRIAHIPQWKDSDGGQLQPEEWAPAILRHYRLVYASQEADQQVPVGLHGHVFEKCFEEEVPQKLPRLVLKNGAAAGSDGITGEVFCAMPAEIVELFLNAAASRNATPAEWKVIPCSIIGKPFKTGIFQNRLIVRLCSGHKLWLSAMTKHITMHVQKTLHSGIYGVRRGDSPSIIIATVATSMQLAHEWCLGTVALSADIAKAFASIPHAAILEACRFIGIPIAWIDAVSDEIYGTTLLLQERGVEVGQVRLGRGLLEGSPVSPLLLAIFMNFVLAQLKADPDFTSAMVTMPACINQVALTLQPIGWVDDWIFMCQNSDSAQIVLNKFAQALRQYDVKLAGDKINFIGGRPGVSLWHEGKQVKKSDYLIVLGAMVDDKGSPVTHAEHRAQMAERSWALAVSTMKLNGIGKSYQMKAFNAIFVPSLAWAVDAFPVTYSACAILDSAALRPLRRLWQGIGEDVPERWRELHRHIRERQDAGDLKCPVPHAIARQERLRARYHHQPNDQFCKLLRWRGVEWQSLDLPRRQRPARREGKPFRHLEQDLRVLRELPPDLRAQERLQQLEARPW